MAIIAWLRRQRNSWNNDWSREHAVVDRIKNVEIPAGVLDETDARKTRKPKVFEIVNATLRGTDEEKERQKLKLTKSKDVFNAIKKTYRNPATLSRIMGNLYTNLSADSQKSLKKDLSNQRSFAKSDRGKAIFSAWNQPDPKEPGGEFAINAEDQAKILNDLSSQKSWSRAKRFFGIKDTAGLDVATNLFQTLNQTRAKEGAKQQAQILCKITGDTPAGISRQYHLFKSLEKDQQARVFSELADLKTPEATNTQKDLFTALGHKKQIELLANPNTTDQAAQHFETLEPKHQVELLQMAGKTAPTIFNKQTTAFKANFLENNPQFSDLYKTLPSDKEKANVLGEIKDDTKRNQLFHKLPEKEQGKVLLNVASVKQAQSLFDNQSTEQQRTCLNNLPDAQKGELLNKLDVATNSTALGLIANDMKGKGNAYFQSLNPSKQVDVLDKVVQAATANQTQRAALEKEGYYQGNATTYQATAQTLLESMKKAPQTDKDVKKLQDAVKPLFKNMDNPTCANAISKLQPEVANKVFPALSDSQKLATLEHQSFFRKTLGFIFPGSSMSVSDTKKAAFGSLKPEEQQKFLRGLEDKDMHNLAAGYRAARDEKPSVQQQAAPTNAPSLPTGPRPSVTNASLSTTPQPSQAPSNVAPPPIPARPAATTPSPSASSAVGAPNLNANCWNFYDKIMFEKEYGGTERGKADPTVAGQISTAQANAIENFRKMTDVQKVSFLMDLANPELNRQGQVDKKGNRIDAEYLEKREFARALTANDPNLDLREHAEDLFNDAAKRWPNSEKESKETKEKPATPTEKSSLSPLPPRPSSPTAQASTSGTSDAKDDQKTAVAKKSESGGISIISPPSSMGKMAAPVALSMMRKKDDDAAEQKRQQQESGPTAGKGFAP